MISTFIQFTNKLKPCGFFLLSGTIVGSLIVCFANLSTEWMLYTYFALIFASLSLIITNKKRYFQFLVILTISVGRPFLVEKPFSIHLGGAQNVPEFFMSDIWLFILLLIWMSNFFKTKQGIKLNIQHIEIAIVLLFGWSCLSVIHARNYEYGFYEIIRMIKQFLLFLYFSHNIKTKKDVKFVVLCLMTVLCIQSCISIFQYLGGKMPFGFFQEIDIEEETTGARRVGGTLYGISALSQFLQLLIPIALALAFYYKEKKWQFPYWTLFSLGTIALIFTFTRSAILSLILSILAIMIIQLVYKKSNRLLFFSRAILIIMIMCVIFIVMQKEIILRFTADDGGSARARIPMMIVALSIIAKNPVFGIGLNNYNEIMGFYDMYVKLGKPIHAVHNVYLFFASEIGVPGLLILLYIIGIIYKKTYTILKQHWGLLQYVTIGIISSVTGYLLILANVAMGFKHLVPIGNLFWLQLGLIVAIENIELKKN